MIDQERSGFGFTPNRRAKGRARVRGTRHRPPHCERLEERSLLTVYPISPLTGPDPGEPLEIALGYLGAHASDFGLSPGDLQTLAVTDMYTDRTGSGMTHIYLRQSYNGLSVESAQIGIHLLADGSVMTANGSFVASLAATDVGAPPAPAISALDALLAGATDLGLTASAAPRVSRDPSGIDQDQILDAPGISIRPVTAQLSYAADAGLQSARLAWEFVITAVSPEFQIYHAFVDAGTGDLLRAYEWVDHLDSYNVFAFPNATPNYGPRVTVTDQASPIASPFGWHDTNGAAGAEFTDTRGNNVDAFVDVNAQGSPSQDRPNGGADLIFDFPIDFGADPLSYADAAVTNLFYANNVIHDLHFIYGFDEASGNFQVTNYSGEGSGNDPVLAAEAYAFNFGAVDNAFMATLPEGESPFMGMFLWDLTSPSRSGGLDGEVIIHEYGHGVSNRLTGGPSNVSALDALQSGAMGEGWGDWWSIMFTQGAATPTRSTVRSVGTYVLGQNLSGPGIRRFPYSYDTLVNPLTLGDFNGGFPNNEVHNAGEIWTQVLWDMNVLLVETHGYEPDLYAGYTGPNSAGNLIALQLVMDALKLQPVNPSFIQARDAILQADTALTGGQNHFEIWTAFARRGFGLSASTANSDSTVVTEAFDIPALLQMIPATVSGFTENEAETNILLAEVRDLLDLATTSYTATVTWGDGTLETVPLQKLGPGRYSIVAPTKTYEEGGQLNIDVSVVRSTDGAAVGRRIINDVVDLAIEGSGTEITGTEGVQFSGFVASFSDLLDPDLHVPSDYFVLVDWQDGTSASNGIITQPDPTRNEFVVEASHTMAGGDDQMIEITIISPGGNTIVRTTIADVVDSELDILQVNSPTPVEGVPFAGALVWFRDRDPRRPGATNYSATITWSDGPVEEDATITPHPSGDGFLVSGDRVFDFSLDPFGFEILIVNHSGPKFAEAMGAVVVEDGDLSASSLNTATQEGVRFRGFIGTFLDEDARPRTPAEAQAHYQVVIDWGEFDGDSDQTVGEVVINIDGGYIVRGEYAYRTAGLYTVTTRVTNTPGDPAKVGEDTALMSVAPAELFVTINPTAPIAEGVPFEGILATFQTPNTLAENGDFLATITWGDETFSEGVIEKISDGLFRVTAPKAYETRGTYEIGVLVTSASGSQAGDVGSIKVVDAPIVVTAVPLVVDAKTALTNILVATFEDRNPNGQAGEFSALVEFGEGLPAVAGVITKNAQGLFEVRASYAYGGEGTFAVTTTVTSQFGSEDSDASTAQVARRLFQLTAGLAGVPAGIVATNSSTPTLTGTAEPSAFITLFAAIPGGQSVQVGTAQADLNGNWISTLITMGDGPYVITGSAVDNRGALSSELTPLFPGVIPGSAPANLVVDTTGPKVSAISLNARTGRLTILFTDPGAGLNELALRNAALYQVTPLGVRNASPLPVQSVTVSPLGAGQVSVDVGFRRYRPARNASALVRILTGGVSDNAGNLLDERFFIPFPSTFARPGSDYLAKFNLANGASSNPIQYVPPPEVRAAEQHRKLVRRNLRRS
jgi:hypothetical protein